MHVPGDPDARLSGLRLELGNYIERKVGISRGDAVYQFAIYVGLGGRKDYFDQISIL
jgi:hypothetical protein